MYHKFYGFKKRPFRLLPDPDFLYRSKKHENALTHLEYGIFDRAGFIVITGEIGARGDRCRQNHPDQVHAQINEQ
jgi:general secretion pathway protein A